LKMKIDCANIESEFHSDNCRIDLIEIHLSQCPACREMYAVDLKLEHTLEDITDNYRSVDITSDVMEQLEIKQSFLANLKLAKTWVNVLTACGILAGMVMILPSLIDLSTDLYSWLMQSADGYALIDLTGVSEIITSINNSGMVTDIIYISVLLLGAVLSYLWVELKTVFQ